jgi:dipeptidyl aminopeptidase/acylaminoacyl peptidase
MIRFFLFAILLGCFTSLFAQPFLQPKDLYKLQSIRSPKLSPDGQWILYSVSKADSVKDKFNSKLYMVSWDGKETVSLTEQTQNPGSHDWSPDGKYISLITTPKDELVRQIFLMDRRGGEPIQLTSVKGQIQAYSWSKDGKQIVLAMKDPSTADTAKTKVRKPYEINRYQFKQDNEGYLDNRKTHLYLFNLETKKVDTLTRGNSNETNPSFHPDGSKIVYVSNTTADPDRNSNTDVFVLDVKTKTSKQLTTFKGADDSPLFSPDGNWIAYKQSNTEDGFNMYDLDQLKVINLATGVAQTIAGTLDRPITSVVWSTDSKQLFFLAEDDRKQHLHKTTVGSNTVETLTTGDVVYQALNTNAKGQFITLFSNPDMPEEIYAWEENKFRAVTQLNKLFIATTKKTWKKGFTSVSKDGTTVSGILFLPDSSSAKLPTILFIHGGPVSQDDYAFDQYREILCGAGFAVAAVNYRGSNGRGQAFTKAIYADWGIKEVMDILGAADYLVKAGYADANRMGIGGWSYGGILTNYTIATDQRFKAAVSGAGSSLQWSIYGTDQYIKQYEQELGAPWKNPKKWMDVSYPFFNVEKIKTPTLFMASEDDFNVPVAGAEQMYQAFKSVGIPTELVIYPGQNHGLSVPSYIVHRYQRHIDWYKKYLTK